MIAVRLVKKLRETFVKSAFIDIFSRIAIGLSKVPPYLDLLTLGSARHLMIDAKSRKVIIVESTFLPSFVKERIARALFDSLKVSLDDF